MCRTCKGGRCRERRDPPLPPLRLNCPDCRNGAGAPSCALCKGAGTFDVAGCPLERPGLAGVFEVLRARTFFERGVPPVAGGSQDQCGAFMDAVRLIDGVVDEARAEQAARE